MDYENFVVGERDVVELLLGIMGLFIFPLLIVVLLLNIVRWVKNIYNLTWLPKYRRSLTISSNFRGKICHYITTVGKCVLAWCSSRKCVTFVHCLYFCGHLHNDRRWWISKTKWILLGLLQKSSLKKKIIFDVWLERYH